MIWPEGKTLREFAGQWWVAHTKSRNEKALAGDLAGKGISYFLPMSWKVKKIRGRTIKSLLPLFGGYLFFCGEERQRVETLKTNRVANLIDVSRPAAISRRAVADRAGDCCGSEFVASRLHQGRAEMQSDWRCAGGACRE